jgi:hypothetical protein
MGGCATARCQEEENCLPIWCFYEKSLLEELDTFLPTARSAVGLVITLWHIHSFYRDIWPFGHFDIWPFYHFDILTFQDRG